MAGQIRNIAQGTVSNSNGSTVVVTFRLERHYPSAGRTSVVTVRLGGSRAIGFALEGDWVEARGSASQGFVNVTQAVNRTSGAQFQATSGNKGLRNGCLVLVRFYLASCLAGLIIYLVYIATKG